MTTSAQVRTSSVVAAATALADYRTTVRAMLGAAPAAGVSPVQSFVLSSPAFDALVASFGPAGAPPTPVHLSQEILVHRAPRPDEALTVHLEVLGARHESKGVRLALGCRVAGDDATPVADLTTGVLLVGATAPEPGGELPGAPAPAAGPAGTPETATVTLSRDLIARYADVSGDHNPIHLDDDAAAAAGFPGVIAHGMSVLAVAVEAIVDRYAGGDAGLVRGVAVRFSAPVRPDEPVQVKLQPDTTGTVVKFSVATPAGVALKAGWVRLGPGDE